MSDVPLPQPAFYCAPKSGKILSVEGYARGDHLQGIMRGNYEPVYFGTELHAHAAAVSAAENARLRERVDTLTDLLILAQQGLLWYQDTYPEVVNDCDAEVMGQIADALKGASHE
jgi:hypothetical protein